MPFCTCCYRGMLLKDLQAPEPGTEPAAMGKIHAEAGTHFCIQYIGGR